MGAGTTGRLSPGELDRLFDAVCGLGASPGPDQRPVTRAVYASLGRGQPVTAARLAAAIGVEPAAAAMLLDSLPSTEREDDGAVVGFGGLTLRPTRHRLTVNGQVRYAWCAWDTLFLPVALDTEAEVTSRCADTGQPVTLRVAPNGVRSRDPDTVALSFVRPDTVDEADLRASFCDAVHFLVEAAAHRGAHAPGRLVLDLDDAFELGRRMIGERCGPC